MRKVGGTSRLRVGKQITKLKADKETLNLLLKINKKQKIEIARLQAQEVRDCEMLENSYQIIWQMKAHPIMTAIRVLLGRPIR